FVCVCCGTEESQATGNGAPDAQSRTLESEKENVCSEDKTIYIRIPLLATFNHKPTEHSVQYVPSRYKLINGFPSDNIVSKTRSYAMSFDNYTGNAEWVYEILNSDTLVNNCDQISFGQGYHKGHLAAACNHSWCREAYNDTYLFSNITPKHCLLNIRKWKDLEKICRDMTTEHEIRNVHVYTGPLYIRPMYQFVSESRFRFSHLADAFIQSRRKIVPTHLFKVIIVENVNGTVRAPECYVMLNDEPQHTDLNVYRMNIETFQRVSGLTFIEHRLNLGDTDRIITVTLQGENLNQTRRYVNIGVRITHNVNQ
uniref:Uncharacterized protein n=1 Tax=Cyprinus carpio TaxID=7962 RepID=A0A8C1RB82_CYPCA